MIAGFENEQVKIASSTFDVTMIVEMTFEVPSTNFNTEKIKEQLTRDRYGWTTGAKINKENLARALGLGCTKFLYIGCSNVDVQKIYVLKYDDDGKTINEAR